jgi:hypothetical protein
MADGVDIQKMASEGLEKVGGNFFGGLLRGAMGFLGALIEPLLWVGGLALLAFGLDKWLNKGELFKPVLEKMGFGDKKPDGAAVGDGKAKPDATPAAEKAAADKAAADKKPEPIKAKTRKEADAACKGISGSLELDDKTDAPICVIPNKPTRPIVIAP